MMIRTQIAMDPEQHRAARRKAAELGLSLAEYIRRLVERDLPQPEPRRGDMARLFGQGNSGGSDVGKHKREYIGKAVEDEWGRKQRR
jgi:hypothetical protein